MNNYVKFEDLPPPPSASAKGDTVKYVKFEDLPPPPPITQDPSVPTDSDLKWPRPQSQAPAQAQPNDTRAWYKKLEDNVFSVPDAAMTMASQATDAIARPVATAGYRLWHGMPDNAKNNAIANKAVDPYLGAPMNYPSPESAGVGRMVGAGLGAIGDVSDRLELDKLGPLGEEAALWGRGIGYTGKILKAATNAVDIPGAARLAATPGAALSAVKRAPGALWDVGKNITNRVGEAAGVSPAPAARDMRGVGADLSLKIPETRAGATAAKPAVSQYKPKVSAEVSHAIEGQPGVKGGMPPSVKEVNEGLLADLVKSKGSAETVRQEAGKALGGIQDRLIGNTGRGMTGADKPLQESDAMHKDLTALIDRLHDERLRHNATTAKGYDAIIADLEHARGAQSPRNALIEERRRMSEKAGFGETPTGYDAIGSVRAKGLAADMNVILDKHVPGYGAARAKYGDALHDLTPFKARFLKAVGADEHTGGDLVGTIMKSTKNVDKAIEAAGDVKIIDGAVAKRVVADMAHMTGRKAAEYLNENKIILDKLPGAEKAAEAIFQRKALRDTRITIRDKLLEQRKTTFDRVAKENKINDAARQMQFDLKQALDPKQTVTAGDIRGIANRMKRADMLTEDQLQEVITRLAAAEGKADSAKTRLNIAKWILYMVGGYPLYRTASVATDHLMSKE